MAACPSHSSNHRAEGSASAAGPLRIGSLELAIPIVLAPMAGYTDSTFRTICLRRGCGLVFTELVSSEGIVRNITRTLNMLHTRDNERPIAAHIYGSDPEVMARAARRTEELGRFDLIDINAGCPVPKIVRKGAGVALMRDPTRLHDIVRAVVQAVSLPVTVKTRTGLSPDNANISEVAHAVEEAGASALFLHARLASARHGGPADLDALSRIKDELSIPVIGNGGITSAASASFMLKETGVDGVMVGRAAIGNPWIFAAITAALAGKEYRPPQSHDWVDVMTRHLRGLYGEMLRENAQRKRPRPHTERAACNRFRGHLTKYLRHAGCPARARRTLLEQQEVEALLRLVAEALQSPNSGEETDAVS
ncbi:MAG TPA: tRNA dihydrouridine synthase DusB [Candidatus Acetothermia bacterium]|nr:tRNA dihydrouridine synthase DusB [Candidatus Acetothermia bacterium]